MKKALMMVATTVAIVSLSGCGNPFAGTRVDTLNTIGIADTLQERQPTPTDIDYSLERYNLIKRAYWVNGQREKARALPCPIAGVPMGHVVLLTESGSVVGKFTVDGKVSSLNSYLTPDSEYFEMAVSSGGWKNKWLADVDGTYGANDEGIFFFTTDGKYIEWTGLYLYSDIPFEVEDPVVRIGR